MSPPPAANPPERTPSFRFLPPESLPLRSPAPPPTARWLLPRRGLGGSGWMHTTVPAQDGASESETESTDTVIPPQTSTSGREVIRIEARASGERDRGRETTEDGMSLLSSARATLASLAAEEVPNMSASEEESLASIRERQARTIDAHTSLISAQRETLRAAERTIHLLQDQIRLYEVRSRFTARLSNSSTSSSSLAASSSNGSPQPSTSASTATGQSPSRHFHSAHNALNTRIRAISLDIARQRDAAKDREKQDTEKGEEQEDVEEEEELVIMQRWLEDLRTGKRAADGTLLVPARRKEIEEERQRGRVRKDMMSVER